MPDQGSEKVAFADMATAGLRASLLVAVQEPEAGERQQQTEGGGGGSGQHARAGSYRNSSLAHRTIPTFPIRQPLSLLWIWVSLVLLLPDVPTSGHRRGSLHGQPRSSLPRITSKSAHSHSTWLSGGFSGFLCHPGPAIIFRALSQACDTSLAPSLKRGAREDGELHLA